MALHYSGIQAVYQFYNGDVDLNPHTDFSKGEPQPLFRSIDCIYKDVRRVSASSHYRSEAKISQIRELPF